MRIGFVGLGKMGASMVERLLGRGHEVVAFDLSRDARERAVEKKAETASSLAGLTKRLQRPRAVWIMVPAGIATRDTIAQLSSLLDSGDIVVDGGNSHYRDSMERARKLAARGIALLDVGTSGGVWGLEEGYCLMVGGDEEACRTMEPIFGALAPEGGYARVGASGAGHFVKMVHNGIEYALLQAYAEGFEVMEAKREFGLDLALVSRLWNRGSVIRSWLLELAEKVFRARPHLEGVRGYVADSGEGRWTVAEAIEGDVPAPVITLSLLERLRSRQRESFSAKVIAALRGEFGGHAVRMTGEGGS